MTAKSNIFIVFLYLINKSFSEAVQNDQNINSFHLPSPSECGHRDDIRPRILDSNETNPGDWPWMAAIGIRTMYTTEFRFAYCSGSLITNQHVVTAAFCLPMTDYNKIYVVRLGEYNLVEDDDGAKPIDIEVQSIILHPQYNRSTGDNDIAILKLKTAVVFTNHIQPICLPLSQSLKTYKLLGTRPIIAGWGTIMDAGPASDVLREAHVTVLSNAYCQYVYSGRKILVNDHFLCSGYTDETVGTDPCQGDSGGPLMLPFGKSYYLFGIIKANRTCSDPKYPARYIRVTKYLDFIVSNLK